MKDEIRILLLKELKCNNIIETFYCIIRGFKGIEHLGLVKGDVNSVKTSPTLRNLMGEVRHVVNLDIGEDKLERAPGLKENLPFIEEVIKVSYKLICRRD